MNKGIMLDLFFICYRSPNVMIYHHNYNYTNGIHTTSNISI